MGKMSFLVDCVKDCLIDNGVVFSVRSYNLENADVQVDGVGMCRRMRGFEVTSKEQLRKYLKRSGFDSIDAWWVAIEQFCAGKRKWMYMVKVKRVPGVIGTAIKHGKVISRTVLKYTGEEEDKSKDLPMEIAKELKRRGIHRKRVMGYEVNRADILQAQETLGEEGPAK